METVDEKGALSKATYKVAVYSAFAMIAFFLLMKLLGLITVVEFRFLNFFIMFIGVRSRLLSARKANDGKLEYLQGMLTGFITALIASLLFAVFIFIYLNIDGAFMQYLKTNQPFGSYLTPGSASLITVIEGVAAGAIIAFAMMHLLNRDSDQG